MAITCRLWLNRAGLIQPRHSCDPFGECVAASTESVVRRLWNNAKDCLWLFDIAAVRRQSGVAAVSAFKCIVEFVHHDLAIHVV
jgi:hypothetical protein